MGAKRAVPGRSKNYDDLLNEFNRERNPNYVEPVKRQTKAERKEKKEKEKAEKKKHGGEQTTFAQTTKVSIGGAQKKGKKAGGLSTGNINGTTGTIPDEAEDENMEEIDSEAELDALSRAVRIAQTSGVIAVPLAVPYDAGTWFVARNERLRNCKDLIASALGLSAAPVTKVPT